MLTDPGELTIRQPATKTSYSAKSWERYLGGTALPPQEAVEELARITGADPVPLLALHEIAVDTWDSSRARPVAQPRPTAQERQRPRQQEQEQEQEEEGEGEEGQEREQGLGQSATPTAPRPGAPATPIAPTAPSASGPAPGRFPHIALTAGVAALTVALLATLLLVLRLDEDGTPAAVAAPPRTTAASLPPSYACRIARVDGRWSAGVNNGRDTEISYGATGADVAEAQCLLRRAGISPGGIDGMFGPLTLRAVKTLQQQAGLVVDGMLGPRSWKALRG
ncbi:peptidoglycan-binding domain-containing protein [Streptomyces sp. NPDC005195]|uniref:peptidoglycan-binding domain-containing protein n=1 Tax=Streptomyces sp. NPDC005195 TaxID=3154561 RepID=UPI0033AC3B0A